MEIVINLHKKLSVYNKCKKYIYKKRNHNKLPKLLNINILKRIHNMGLLRTGIHDCPNNLSLNSCPIFVVYNKVICKVRQFGGQERPVSA